MALSYSDDPVRQYGFLAKLVTNDFPEDLADCFEETSVVKLFKEVYNNVLTQHSRINNSYYSSAGKGIIDLSYLDHYLILCHRFAHALSGEINNRYLADAVYYSCRIRTSTDLFHRCEIGDYFMPVHPLGAVVGSRAKFGKAFKLFNGVHVGPYGIDGKPPSEWVHPVVGDGVTVYANSCIYGRTVVGNNVTISPGTTIINEEIPDNCVVFGASPDLKVMPNRYDNLAIIGM
jgi:serine O-acetyltransferase